MGVDHPSAPRCLVITQSDVGFVVNSEGCWHDTDKHLPACEQKTNAHHNTNKQKQIISFATNTDSRKTANL